MMYRIEHITVTPIAFREPPLLAASGMHQPWAIRSIIEMHVEGKIVGLGETYGDLAVQAGLRNAAKRLIGKRVTDLNAIRQAAIDAVAEIDPMDAVRGTHMPEPHETLHLRLMGGLEVAALDAWGKAVGLRFCDLLGGPVREKVPYAAYLFYRFRHHKGYENDTDDWGEALTPEAVVAQAGRMIERFGFKSLKLKTGVFDPALDLETIAALKAAFPNHPLRVDPNTNWSEETTRRLLPHFAGLLEYLEDPVAGIDGMSRIQLQTSIPLATNMCVKRLEQLPEAIAKRAIGVVLADHHFWGGVTATMNLVEICRVWNIGLSMHSNSHLGISLAAMTHIGAAIPGKIYDFDTHYSWERGDVIEGGLMPFMEGEVSVPEGPGLGVSIDRDTFTRMANDYQTHGYAYRDDVDEMLKHWPEWSAGPMPKF